MQSKSTVFGLMMWIADSVTLGWCRMQVMGALRMGRGRLPSSLRSFVYILERSKQMIGLPVTPVAL
jgi:hypothetical protein